jgi:hypothetical protein
MEEEDKAFSGIKSTNCGEGARAEQQESKLAAKSRRIHVRPLWLSRVALYTLTAGIVMTGLAVTVQVLFVGYSRHMS